MVSCTRSAAPVGCGLLSFVHIPSSAAKGLPMADSSPGFHHLLCLQAGSVTVAVAGQSAFAESSHPDDWTPHLLDTATNRELKDDLSLLATTCPGPVVLDMREVCGLRGSAMARLMVFALQMTAGGKPLAVCASPGVLQVLKLSGCARHTLCCTGDLDTALGRASAAVPGTTPDQVSKAGPDG